MDVRTYNSHTPLLITHRENMELKVIIEPLEVREEILNTAKRRLGLLKENEELKRRMKEMEEKARMKRRYYCENSKRYRSKTERKSQRPRENIGNGIRRQ